MCVHACKCLCEKATVMCLRPGFNICLEWSNHKWTAQSKGVNAPKTHLGRIWEAITQAKKFFAHLIGPHTLIYLHAGCWFTQLLIGLLPLSFSLTHMHTHTNHKHIDNCHTQAGELQAHLIFADRNDVRVYLYLSGEVRSNHEWSLETHVHSKARCEPAY